MGLVLQHGAYLWIAKEQDGGVLFAAGAAVVTLSVGRVEGTGAEVGGWR
jgi:hypothetical protein